MGVVVSLRWIGFSIAVYLIFIGLDVILHDAYSSIYQDGGVFYEDSGLEVRYSSNPIRVGDCLFSIRGPLYLALGLISFASLCQLAPKEKI